MSKIWWRPNSNRQSRRCVYGRLALVRLRRWRPTLEVLEDRLAPAVITVNSTADTLSPPPGTVTLRSAIVQANSSPGSTIDFNIPGSGVHVIQPASALPAITSPVVINGYSQPSSSPNTLTTRDNAVLQIVLDGSLAGSNVEGLAISGGGSTVEGLDIRKFSLDGILLQGGGSNNLIEGNFIGTDATGTTAQANSGNGVNVANGSSFNTIGGTTPAARNVISGSAVNGLFTGNGIFLTTGSNGNVVLGNYIGTDITGAVALANGQGGITVREGASANTVGGTVSAARNVISGNHLGVEVGGTNNVVLGNYIGLNAQGNGVLPNVALGVDLGGNNNTIGGTAAGAGNVISGNSGDGVLMAGITVTGNQVLGNRIGTNPAGTAALPNGAGIEIEFGPASNTIGGTAARAGNVISGNFGDGINIHDSSSSNAVIHNFIGTNAAGSAAVPNRINGVEIVGGASDNTISGRNVISGNLGTGVRIFGLSSSTIRIATGNVVQGNFIGTDARGKSAIGNHFGVVIGGDSTGNTVGGTSAGARNIISGNSGMGILINGAGTTSNVVAGNRIGTDKSGRNALPNRSNGVGIYNGASGNTIGGTSTGTANRIAFNRGAGVVVVGSTTVKDSIQGNSIFGNAHLGIDLGADGVTPNDPTNPDTGPNNRQNYPVLISAINTSATGTTIAGTLHSAMSATFRVELFATPTADPSGFGQGKSFLGFTTVTTDSSGNGSFTFHVAAPVAVGHFISATATDAAGDTSEFAKDVKVVSGPAILTHAAAASTDIAGISRATPLSLSGERSSPPTSLLPALTARTVAGGEMPGMADGPPRPSVESKCAHPASCTIRVRRPDRLG
jgi:hypothetical protein